MTQVVFLHIPKTGGSTIRHMLNMIYPYGVQYPVPVDSSKKKEVYRTQPYTVHQVYQHLDSSDVSNFDLFMGHYDWQLVQRLGTDAIVLTMLRDPVQQLYSMFRYFWIDTKHYGQLKYAFQSSGFEGFLNSEMVSLFTNQQTRFLSGRYYGYSENDLNNGVLTNAKRNLKKSVYGLMERWDDSIRLFEARIGQKLPTIAVQNHNRTRLATPLSQAVIERVRELQSYDVSLYEYAQAHFEEQV